MVKLSPQVARAYELLADGQWHDREQIMREMYKAITPGIAVRYAEKERTYSGLEKNRPLVRQVPRSQEFLIASGKRALSRAGLRSRRVLHRIDPETGAKQVRLLPAKPLPNSRAGRLARGLTVRDLPPPPPPPPPAASYRAITPYLRRAFEVLADGQWHERESVLAEMLPLVDRSVAIAVAERRREESRIRGTTPERRKRRDDTPYLVEAGARTVAMGALGTAKRIQRQDRDGFIMLRLRAPNYNHEEPSV